VRAPQLPVPLAEREALVHGLAQAGLLARETAAV